ncbi:MAG: DNA helicase RecQ [Gammaproteobacteria bacterium]
MSSQSETILKEVFGYDGFRHSQAQIINCLLDSQDCLVLMPTGGGKSLCYQIPALIREGVAIVVSPLIALMQDQVEALKQLGISAGYLNSTQDQEQRWATKNALAAGELKLLYLSPERLLMPDTLDFLDQLEIGLFAIDEAHCVSHWGHDFRKEYKQLECLPTRFPKVPRIALTATADKRVRREIVEQLHLEQAQHFVHSFDRPNICYQVVDADNSRQQLWQFLSNYHQNDAGIVYCLSRKRAESVAAWLNQQGRTALAYHAGMSDQDRARNQRRFLVENGIVMVATIAFGMGIDKPDVRFVAHLNLPKNLEAYYQETGRAGRDGLPANAWMAYSLKDVMTLSSFVEDSEAGDAHKQLMQHKLRTMLGWCEITSCRRRALLQYFDEIMQEGCGNCDNCLSPPEVFDNTENAQRALSCVYRTGQRFGVNYLIEILQGSTKDPRVKQYGHDQLGLVGTGASVPTRDWRDLFRQLIASGYLTMDDEGYGSLVLDPSCRPVLRGEVSVMQRHQTKTTKTRKKSADAELDPEDESLFEALRALRSELAKQHGIPPYLVFHDSTLASLATHKPQEYDELMNINGIGRQKQERYGEEFLTLIRELAG